MNALIDGDSIQNHRKLVNMKRIWEANDAKEIADT
jgi:hypothetical protein